VKEPNLTNRSLNVPAFCSFISACASVVVAAAAPPPGDQYSVVLAVVVGPPALPLTNIVLAWTAKPRSPLALFYHKHLVQ